MIFKRAKKLSVLIFSILMLSTVQIAAGAEYNPDKLVPGGMAMGISIKVDGVIVSELSEKETEKGTISPARDAGIQPGDIITQINGSQITCVEDLTKVISREKGDITVRVKRGNEELQLTLSPYRTENECFIGVWVRDSMNGIGTVTFYDPDTGKYGALGHSINDADTGVIIPIKEGNIMSVEISGITIGKTGTPGQLGGVLNTSDILGDIDSNTVSGIFGTADNALSNNGALPICSEEDIKTGEVTILSAADGSVKEYKAEITRVYTGDNDGRTMMLKITDKDLIDLTGGIVQGMSGSPILQDGKLVGAVTHVLINDPTKGYGISIEDMLEAAGKAA